MPFYNRLFFKKKKLVKLCLRIPFQTNQNELGDNFEKVLVAPNVDIEIISNLL